MNPPNVYEVARPNPQRTRRTTASVHNMIAPSFRLVSRAGGMPADGGDHSPHETTTHSRGYALMLRGLASAAQVFRVLA